MCKLSLTRQAALYSFFRKDETGRNNIMFVINMTPMMWENYMIGVPKKKKYKLLLKASRLELETTKGGSKKSKNRSIKYVYSEDSLGIKLFERTHRGLTLTKAGKSLYQDTKYIIQYCRDSVTRAKNAMQFFCLSRYHPCVAKTYNTLNPIFLT